MCWGRRGASGGRFPLIKRLHSLLPMVESLWRIASFDRRLHFVRKKKEFLEDTFYCYEARVGGGGEKGIDFLTKVTVSYLSHSSGRDIT